MLGRVLGCIAPEVDLDAIDPDAQLLEAGGLDSVDFLALVSGLHDETGIDVPVREYPAVSTIAGFVDYVVNVSAPRRGA